MGLAKRVNAADNASVTNKEFLGSNLNLKTRYPDWWFFYDMLGNSSSEDTATSLPVLSDTYAWSICHSTLNILQCRQTNH
jgi:hypothetical protein